MPNNGIVNKYGPKRNLFDLLESAVLLAVLDHPVVCCALLALVASKGQEKGKVRLGINAGSLLPGSGPHRESTRWTYHPRGDVAEWVSFDEVFRQSDVLSVHVRLSTETSGLIRREHLELMKPGAILPHSWQHQRARSANHPRR